MLQDYKEIIYGIILGIAAAALDTGMDARIEGHTFWAELTGHSSMLLYRGIFVFFGLIIGGLAWKNNQRKRDFRHLLERIKRCRDQFEGNLLVLHTKLQLLLTKDSFHLSSEAEQQVRAAYDTSRELQKIADDIPPLDDVS